MSHLTLKNQMLIFGGMIKMTDKIFKTEGKSNAILVSFFNSDNLGDILIGDMLTELSSNYFNVDRISYTGSPIVGCSTNGKNVIDFKTNIIKYLSKVPLAKQVLYTARKNKPLNLEYFESKIKDSDILVIGGGNMIFDLEKYSFSSKRFRTFVMMAKKYNKKVFAISLGIGPFQTVKQEKDAIKALEMCDYITFRDEASFEIFKRHNQTHNDVYVSIDPVFLLQRKTKEVSEDKVIALNIINNKLMKESEKSYKNLINQYAKLADNLVENLGKKVVLFSTEIADYDAVFDVSKLVKNNKLIEVIKINTVEELFRLYSNVIVLVGTRMHSMIVAHSQEIPVVGLSWQKKVDEMFDIIEANDSLFKYDEISKYSSSIIELTKFKIDNIENEKNKIRKNLFLLNSKIEINRSIFNKLLEDQKYIRKQKKELE